MSLHAYELMKSPQSPHKSRLTGEWGCIYNLSDSLQDHCASPDETARRGRPAVCSAMSRSGPAAPRQEDGQTMFGDRLGGGCLKGPCLHKAALLSQCFQSVYLMVNSRAQTTM